MSKYIVKSGSFYGAFYYIQSKGFTGSKTQATRLEYSEAQGVASCAKNMGHAGPVIEKVSVSFAVNYIRPENLDANGNVKPDARNPSRRRFATRQEAEKHASRFMERKKKNSTELAGHCGAYVTESTDEVNAYVNPDTGLTNSL